MKPVIEGVFIGLAVVTVTLLTVPWLLKFATFYWNLVMQ
jgi:hypothetical protein